MSKRGILAIISGFSGAGKGTIVGELVRKYGYAISISATTRSPREGEEEGVNYFFKSREAFEEMIRREEFIEYAQYVGNYYGTPKSYVMQQLEAGRDVLLEIEMQGALKVKEKFPEVTLIFITPPNVSELRKRLEGRGTETPEAIERRIARAKEECAYMRKYDYIVVNDQLGACVDEMHALLQSLHCARDNQSGFIDEITAGFRDI